MTQIKYLVYNTKESKLPIVKIWETNGSLTHTVFMNIHNIKPADLSSLGYVIYFPRLKKWKLEHYPMTCIDGGPLLKTLIKNHRLKQRDKALVNKELYKSSIFKNTQLQKASYDDYVKFQKLKKKCTWKPLVSYFCKIFKVNSR